MADPNLAQAAARPAGPAAGLASEPLGHVHSVTGSHASIGLLSADVLQRRIEKAKEMLRNTDLPIVDVALSVGFSSQSHLSHWFLRQVGVSPAAYRRQ